MPLVPTLVPNVYASLWWDEHTRLWTLVNRSHEDVSGVCIQVQLAPGEELYDLVIGRAYQVNKRGPGGECDVRIQIKGRGVGCILAAHPGDLGKDFLAFLARQNRLWVRVLPERNPPELRTRLRPVPKCRRRPSLPEGMAAIPAVSRTFRIEFRVRECGFCESRHPLAEKGGQASHQPIWFERSAVLQPYAIDLTPVTNAQFAEFLKRSHYRPRYRENFLRHWVDGAPPSGKEDYPVVYVDLDDARAYAAHFGKRLPTEEEWQQGAQGDDGRKYPWGNEMLSGCCDNGNTGQPTPVGAFPAGRSPFGLYDMCGNVWHWTESERSDGHSRFAILRGGSAYLRGGSDWYFDEGPKPVWFAAKMLLMWPGLDRCANVGFRCVVDS